MRFLVNVATAVANSRNVKNSTHSKKKNAFYFAKCEPERIFYPKPSNLAREISEGFSSYFTKKYKHEIHVSVEQQFSIFKLISIGHEWTNRCKYSFIVTCLSIIKNYKLVSILEI